MLNVRRIVAEALVDAVVSIAMDTTSLSRLRSMSGEENPAECA